MVRSLTVAQLRSSNSRNNLTMYSQLDNGIIFATSVNNAPQQLYIANSKSLKNYREKKESYDVKIHQM